MYVICQIYLRASNTVHGILSGINNLRNSAFQSKEIILFYACDNMGHYQNTVTPIRDVLTPNRDVMSAKCSFPLNVKQARVLHRAHERLSIYAMISMPGQIKIFSQG